MISGVTSPAYSCLPWSYTARHPTLFWHLRPGVLKPRCLRQPWFRSKAPDTLYPCNALLKRIFPGDQAQTRRYLLVLLAAVFMIDRTRSFGQRDHLVVLLLTPYLLAMTTRWLACGAQREE